jgi:hypothetical protein
MGLGVTDPTQKKAALTTLSGTPVGTFYCPSRRPAAGTPNLYSNPQPYYNANRADPVARSDYAANLGPCFKDDLTSTQRLTGPSSFVRADQGMGFYRDMTYVDNGQTLNWMTKIHGIVFQAYEYKFKQITDGTSKTYMVGEKFLQPEWYSLDPGGNPVPSDYGDDQSCWAGDDLDMNRNADNKVPPLPDQPGLQVWNNFGSAHPGVFQMAMCDASVHGISYNIDPVTHEELGDRSDGAVVSDY